MELKLFLLVLTIHSLLSINRRICFHTNELCENLLNHTKTNDNVKYNRIIIEEDKYKYFTDKETIINLHSLSNLYQKYYNDNIMKFFKKVSRNACIMMSLLWKMELLK